MKQLLIVATLLASTTVFANDPAAHGTAPTGTTQADPTTPATPPEKHAKPMKKHKGSAGKEHPSMNKPAEGAAETAPKQ
jgi:hypothetical protein